MLSQAVLIAGVIGLIGVNIKGGVMCSHCVLHTPPTYVASLSIFLLFFFPDGDCQTTECNFSSNYAFPVTRGRF